MRNLLDFFSLKDTVPLILLICLLEFVGGRMTGESNAPRLWARRFAAAGFLLYACLAIAETEPATPSEFLSLSLQALLAMGTVRGLALVTLPVVRFLYLHAWAAPVQRQCAAEEQRARQAEALKRESEAAESIRAEQERKAEQQQRQDEEAASRPPPPTREDRMAAAKARYDAALGMLAKASLNDTELHAARERVKQQYLRELDEVIR